MIKIFFFQKEAERPGGKNLNLQQTLEIDSISLYLEMVWYIIQAMILTLLLNYFTDNFEW